MSNNGPTKADYEDMSDIQSRFDERFNEKYLAGVREHGGHLWERRVDVDILDEAIDQVAYAVTNIRHHEQIIDLIQAANESGDLNEAGKRMGETITAIIRGN